MNKNKLVLLFLCMPIMVRPLGLELFAGAILGRLATSAPARAAGYIATGYMLRTPLGQKALSKAATMSFDKIRQSAGTFWYGPTYTLPVIDTSSTVTIAGVTFASRQAPTVVSGFLQRMQQQAEQLKATAQERSIVWGKPIVNNVHAKGFGPFAAAEGQAAGSTAAQAANAASAILNVEQKVHGLFPRITNNYHYGNGSSNYWKGFATGSFGAWTTAWTASLFVNKKRSNQQEENH